MRQVFKKKKKKATEVLLLSLSPLSLSLSLSHTHTLTAQRERERERENFVNGVKYTWTKKIFEAQNVGLRLQFSAARQQFERR